ncbi:hypothetical protein SPRG_08847 [Saprolegnia parasitica CBS 223.65]|uniref:Methyltransferase small domain-containing protein n=1 Tax=Saprolegnia parasitica (strain CBS 223.65) TaxID=695850 RepID=A0A067CH82_SAPPC|nr:hypothetical protein SPRG_08847 [Saprolegnia parasitica CBS 223.65]KDO25906.1 hypothetical protein SPRG_08847 [Saprolegnia parasitica CBS 223.65]|eukprot:XP_012203466.1 hypothetical protein SPRG_08847 [Saprolegnia parasitica CBS 223.65]
MEVVEIPVRATSADGTDRDDVVELGCNWGVGIGGSLWTSGRLMVDYFSRNVRARQQLQGASVLELGSGTGLVGLALACMGPASVVLTDLESHVAALQANVERNSARFSDGTLVSVAALDWNTASADDATAPLDWIVGTDIAYMPEFYAPLLKTLQLLAGPNTRILVGLGRHDTDMRFFRLLQDAGFSYYKVSDELVSEEFRGKDFGLFEIQRV